MFSTFCYVVACREAHGGVYGIAALSSAVVSRLPGRGTRVLGWCFGNLTEGETFMHLSVVCVVCVYVLGMVVLLWRTTRAPGKNTWKWW